jgi:DNA-binding NtrC family response regulator
MGALNNQRESPNANARVLVVDDEPGICLLLKALLDQAGFNCQTASSGNEALEILKQQEFDALISDLRMPGISGLALLGAARAKYPQMCFLIATGGGDVQQGVDAVKSGADDYVMKPFRRDAVVAALQRALEKRTR